MTNDTAPDFPCWYWESHDGRNICGSRGYLHGEPAIAIFPDADNPSNLVTIPLRIVVEMMRDD